MPDKTNTMKLHLHINSESYTITGHGPGYVAVDGRRYPHAVLLLPDQPPVPWVSKPADALDREDFAALLAARPEIVIFGSGGRFQFADMRIATAFATAHIGFETMDTAAACRTVNVLQAEGRRVGAALLVEPDEAVN